MEREGADRPVPRGHSEQITIDGEDEPAVVKLGVWISNTKSRRDRLDAEQLAALAELGMDWAGPAPAAAPDPPTRPSQRIHHDECEKTLYEGGTCTATSSSSTGRPPTTMTTDRSAPDLSSTAQG
ncbi:helicase associated domain-containing protein [Streptomyces gobitricini]|uniref:Helicase-associated domain-containing protein n=1 Tax=Streptomyces gobitricini TaxID=68211 RepID=A0ABP6AMK8_9ACTN